MRCADHVRAWRRFWSDERIQQVSGVLKRQGAALGFADGAFGPFVDMLTVDSPVETTVPPSVFSLLGISRDEADGRWRQVTRITPREPFDSQRFTDARYRREKIFRSGRYP